MPASLREYSRKKKNKKKPGKKPMEKSQSLNWQDLRSVHRATSIKLSPYPDHLKLLKKMAHSGWFVSFLGFFRTNSANFSGGKFKFYTNLIFGFSLNTGHKSSSAKCQVSQRFRNSEGTRDLHAEQESSPPSLPRY